MLSDQEFRNQYSQAQGHARASLIITLALGGIKKAKEREKNAKKFADDFCKAIEGKVGPSNF